MAKSSAAAGTSAALIGGSKVVGVLGFGKAGIAAGSTAASMMSVLGGAATPAGGVVATMQSVGALGTVFVSAPAVIVTATVGGAIGLATYGGYRLIRRLRK